MNLDHHLLNQLEFGADFLDYFVLGTLNIQSQEVDGFVQVFRQANAPHLGLHSAIHDSLWTLRYAASGRAIQIVTKVHVPFSVPDSGLDQVYPLIAERARNEGSSPEEVKERLNQANSVRRIMDASEVAYVVAFLASPKAIAITGDVICAGGGPGRAIYY